MDNRVKVALLDTGIDKSNEFLKDNIIGGMSYVNNKDYILVSKEYNDENGHGTSCASIIKNEFDNVEIFAMKILDKNGKCNIQILEEALKYLINTNIRLINLSLSIMDSKFANDLYNICNKLVNKDKIIVCSLANGFNESYPAIFDNVIGVKGFVLESENAFWYNKNKKIQCVMDNNPYLTCHLDNSYKLFGKCNSQAAAKLTGKIAKILSTKNNITLNQLHKKLENLATSNNWFDEDFSEIKRYADFKFDLYKRDNERLITVKNVLGRVLNIRDDEEKLYNLGLFSNEIGLNYDGCFNIIKELERELNIKFNYRKISRYDFASIYTLVELIEKNLKGE